MPRLLPNARTAFSANKERSFVRQSGFRRFAFRLEEENKQRNLGLGSHSSFLTKETPHKAE